LCSSDDYHLRQQLGGGELIIPVNVVEGIRSVGDGVLWFLWILSQCVTWPVAILLVAFFFRSQLVGLFRRVIELGPSGVRFAQEQLREGIHPPETIGARETASATQPDEYETIVADAFVLRGPDNSASAVLAIDQNGLPRLIFQDHERKKAALSLAILPNGKPSIYMEGADSGLSIGITDDDTPFVSIFGHGQKLRAVLRTLDDGAVGLALFSRQGELKTYLQVDASDQPDLYQSHDSPPKSEK
jgi:hypothetical protein